MDQGSGDIAPPLSVLAGDNHDVRSDESPDKSVDATEVLLTRAKDPVLAALQAAPFDDETESDEERRAVAEAHSDRERGIEPVPLESVLAEFDSDQ